MKNTKTFGVLLLSSTLLAGSALASTTKAVVVDKDGDVVKSMLSRECVRTKWEKGMNVCGSKEVAKPQVKKQPEPVKTHNPRREQPKIYNRSYQLFFDFNSSKLSSDAKNTLNQLVSAANASGATGYTLVGHADRVGSSSYNDALSKKRAMSVKNGLVNLGVDAKDVSISWKGENSPLIATKDGIKEPQNRRVEVHVSGK